jgi:hypothetical protein
MYDALPLNRRNLLARSVLRHSSGNEMRPASRITYSDLACYQRGCPKSSCCALYMAEAASHNRQKAPLLVCTSCETTLPTGGVHLPRRKFLALLGAALAVPLSGPAAEKGAPPKPQNVLSPDQALDRLMQGNRRYLGGNMRRHDFSAERPALARPKPIRRSPQLRRFTDWARIRLRFRPRRPFRLPGSREFCQRRLDREL